MIYANVQGEAIPALGLGTWLLRGDACVDAVTHALDLGYRHIDTAQSYENEAAVGQALRQSGLDREQLFLTTKIGLDNLRPKDARRTSEDSLRRLQTEYVDLLLIHWPSEEVEPERTLDVMMKLQDEGKTRLIGVSNFPPSWLERAAQHAPVVCNQVEYHPFLSQAENLALAEKYDLLITAYSPIARGRVFDDATLQAIGAAHGKNPAQVALRWLVQQGRVAAIPKAASAEHRASNFAIFDFTLSDDEMAQISNLARDERLVDPDWAPAWEE